MEDREAINAIQESLQKFLDAVKRLKQEHSVKISRIIKKVEEARMKALKDELSS